LKIDDDVFFASDNNLLLRGSTLKNIDFVYALAVYTGHNTKVMLNSV